MQTSKTSGGQNDLADLSKQNQAATANTAAGGFYGSKKGIYNELRNRTTMPKLESGGYRTLNNMSTDYSAYALRARNYLAKGLSLCPTGKENTTGANAAGAAEANEASITNANASSKDKYADKLAEAHWIAANLVGYYNKHGINLQNNQTTGQAKGLCTGIAQNDYKQTGDESNEAMIAAMHNEASVLSSVKIDYNLGLCSK